MSLVLRLVKGSPLTNAEVDGNFTYLNNKPTLPAQSGNAGRYLTTDGSNASWVTINPLPSQTGNAGKYLITDGTNASWVALNPLPPQTGNAGKYLTTDGSFASWVSLDPLPDQTGNSGKYLTTDGINASWITLSIPSGSLVNTTDPQTLSNKTFASYREVVSTVGTVSASTYNINLATANIFDITLGNNVTFTFTNPPSSGTLITCTIILRQDSTGNRTATFTNAKYTDGILPILSTGANQLDILSFATINGGASYFGSFVMANVS